MTVNNSRSMNAELAEGMSDGKFKKIIADRGGVVHPETYDDRRDLSSAHFDIAETKVKHLGDGTVHVTPDFIDFPIGRPANSLF